MQKQVVAEQLAPLKDRILCGVPGNHERRSQRDCDCSPSYDIMCKLNLEHLYRENIAFVRIKMGDYKGAGQHNPCYMLAITHGASGGALPGSTLNKSINFANSLDGCDVFICGHAHKPSIAPPAKIVIDGQHGMAFIKPFYIVNATAWMDYGGYAAQKMLLPSSIAPQVITLFGRKKKVAVSTSCTM